MAYKTNPVGNRLGISFGWQHAFYPASLRGYSDSTLNWLKLYLFIKSYLEKTSSRIISFKIKVINKLPVISILFYKYKKVKYGWEPRFRRRKEIVAFRPETGWIPTHKNPEKVQALPLRPWFDRTVDFALICGLATGIKKTYSACLVERKLNSPSYKQFRRPIQLNKWSCLILNKKKATKKVSKNQSFSKKCMERFLRAKAQPYFYKKERKKRRSIARGNYNRAILSKWVSHYAKKKLQIFGNIWRKIPGKKNYECVSYWQIKYNIIVLHTRQPKFNHKEFLRLIYLRYQMRRLLRCAGFDVPVLKIIDPVESLSAKHVQAIYFRKDLGRYRNQKYYANTIKILQMVKLYKTPQLLADHIASELERNKRHTAFLYALQMMFQKAFPGRRHAVFRKRRRVRHKRAVIPKNSQLFNYTPMSQYKAAKLFRVQEFYSGIRVSVFGKLNAKSRTRSLVLASGATMARHIFDYKINYALAHARARTGTFGVKVWLLT